MIADLSAAVPSGTGKNGKPASWILGPKVRARSSIWRHAAWNGQRAAEKEAHTQPQVLSRPKALQSVLVMGKRMVTVASTMLSVAEETSMRVASISRNMKKQAMAARFANPMGAPDT